MARLKFTLTFTGPIETDFDATDEAALATLSQQIAEDPIDWLCGIDEECDLDIAIEPVEETE